MFKQVYMRSLDWRPPCRRSLNPDTGDVRRTEARVAGLVAELLTAAQAGLWCCSRCGVNQSESERMVLMCPLPTRETSESLRASSGSSVMRSSSFELFPELWAFLTCTAFPDGNARQGGKLSLSCERNSWSLVLTDPSTSLYACLNGNDLDDLVLMAEARLAQGTMSWRPSRYEQPRKGRRNS